MSMPNDIWQRMMRGEITAHEAVVQAEEANARRKPFNDELRREIAKPDTVRHAEQQELLRARLFPQQDQPRDEAGRFVSDERCGRNGWCVSGLGGASARATG